MIQLVDLHVHSTASDGTMTPSKLVSYAKQKELYAFALTDHDTTAGISEAQVCAVKSGVRLIPGIEFSTEYEGRDVHILGLGIDPENDRLLAGTASIQEERAQRNEKMIRLLQNDGYPISLQMLQEQFPGAVLTRVHIVKCLVQQKCIASIQEGFTNYVGSGCKYYVPRTYLSPLEAIALIHEAGGKAVLAHPLLYHLDMGQLRTLLGRLVSGGLDALEAIYSCNEDGQEQQMRALAKEFGIKISGGSDFHGANKPDIDLKTGKGNLIVPVSVLVDLFDGSYTSDL